LIFIFLIILSQCVLLLQWLSYLLVDVDYTVVQYPVKQDYLYSQDVWMFDLFFTYKRLYFISLAKVRYFFASYFPLRRLQIVLEEHVIDSLKYGDKYFDIDVLVKACTRIYKEGVSMKLEETLKENSSGLGKVLVGNFELDKSLKTVTYDVLHEQTNIISKLGMNKKIIITKWLELNNYNYLTLPKPDIYFVENCILAKPKPINAFSVLLVGFKSRYSFQPKSRVGHVFINSYKNFSTARFYTSKVNTMNKAFKYDSPIYKNLNILIKDNLINDETQIKIEKFLFDYSYISLDNEGLNKPFSAIDYSIINPKLSKLLLESKELLIKLIINFKQEFKSSKSFKDSQIDLAQIELAKILVEIKDTYTVSIMYGRLLKIISTYQRSEDSLNSMVDVSYNLGKDILNSYYYNKYLKSKSNKYLKSKSNINKIYHLSNWKSDNKMLVDKYEDTTFIFNLGSILVGWLLTCDLLEKKTVTISKKEKVNILLPVKRLIETISNNTVFNLPKRMPMLVPPKPYKKESLGGYLLNDELTTDSLLKPKRNNKELTTIKDDNVLYDLVNNISSVGYKINKDVLEFVLFSSNNYFKDDIIDIYYKHPLLEKSKLTIREKRELDRYLSKKELQENILGLASVLSDVPSFYMPVNLDFRGRLNCIPEFLNYQSNELAKALLLFSNGEKIDKKDRVSINYLKLYGAACFGLDKKSAQYRLDWVDSNLKNIIDFRNGELIKKAKNKYLFLAFCFEYNKWLICLENNDISSFETYLPIQLDATCNGFQHLSLLSLDPQLASELNLNESSWKDKPKDFYSFLVAGLMDHFKKELDNNKDLSMEKQEGYQRLINFNLQRYIIKKSVMTIPYNVSSYQLIKYIKENFLRLDNTEWFYTIENKELKLKYSDFTLLGNGLREVLDYKFPKLNLLLTYLENIAKVCTILQIPILWTLPSGLEVKQSYMMEDTLRIKPFFYHKNHFVLKVFNKSLYDNKKQITAFMPNLVHSLDAASLALLLDFYFKGARNVKNIYTIHDCFAVTANNVSNMMDLLKLTYINIYSEDTYLKKLDKGIIDNIKLVYGENSFNDKTRTIYLSTSNTTISFPDVNIVLGKKVKFDFNSLLKSQYILN